MGNLLADDGKMVAEKPGERVETDAAANFWCDDGKFGSGLLQRPNLRAVEFDHGRAFLPG